MASDLRRFRLATAKRLRNNATGAEQKLWRAIRRIPMHGTHFRRQVAIGPYVADFACQRMKLIVEIDGSQHADPLNTERDAMRTRWLNAEGYRVVRFWNSDVTENIEGVLLQIQELLRPPGADETRPTPARFASRPSPSRGG